MIEFMGKTNVFENASDDTSTKPNISAFNAVKYLV